MQVVRDDWVPEKDWVRTTLNCSAAPGKFQQGQWRVLEPELPLEESHTSQEWVCISIPAMFLQWLGVGSGPHMVTKPKGWLLKAISQ